MTQACGECNFDDRLGNQTITDEAILEGLRVAETELWDATVGVMQMPPELSAGELRKLTRKIQRKAGKLTSKFTVGYEAAVDAIDRANTEASAIDCSKTDCDLRTSCPRLIRQVQGTAEAHTAIESW